MYVHIYEDKHMYMDLLSIVITVILITVRKVQSVIQISKQISTSLKEKTRKTKQAKQRRKKESPVTHLTRELGPSITMKDFAIDQTDAFAVTASGRVKKHVWRDTAEVPFKGFDGLRDTVCNTLAGNGCERTHGHGGESQLIGLRSDDCRYWVPRAGAGKGCQLMSTISM